jgi:hypothetical protein
VTTARHARPRRSGLRRAWAVALTVGMGISLAGMASNALLTDSESVGSNAFTSAVLDLSAGSSTAITASGMVPGDVITAPLTMTNAGTADLRYSMRSVTSEDYLASALIMTVQTRLANDASCSAFNGTPLYSGTLGSTSGIKIVGDPAGGAQSYDRVLPVGSADGWCVRIALPLTADNTYATKTTTATFMFDAEQTRNNGPVYVAPTASGSVFADMTGGMTNVDLTVPAGVSAGDLGILVTATDNSPLDTTSSAGWTTRVVNPAGQNNSAVSVLTRLGGLKAGDTFNVARNGSGGASITAVWLRTGGRDALTTGTPWTRNGVSQTTTTVPGISTSSDGVDVLVVATERTLANGTTVTASAPTTPTQDYFREATQSATSMYIGHFTQATAGNTGNYTLTYNTGSGNAVGVMLMLGQTGTTP